jgi:hypothetical protein
MKLLINLAATLLLLQPGLAQDFPTCVSSVSDSDGDGYGWENNQSCLVVASTAGDCEDRGGYPWGWNPVTLKSCRLDLGQSTTDNSEPSSSECVDTDPVNDGWGWNGVTSCRVPLERDVYRCDDVGSAPWGWNATLSTSCRLDLRDTPVPESVPDPEFLLGAVSISPIEILNEPLICRRVEWWTQFETNPINNRLEFLENQQSPPAIFVTAFEQGSTIFFTAILRDLNTVTDDYGVQRQLMNIEGSWSDIFLEDISIALNGGGDGLLYTIGQQSSPSKGGDISFYRNAQYIVINRTYSYFDNYQSITSYCVLNDN